MKYNYYILICVLLSLCACDKDSQVMEPIVDKELSLVSEILPFEGVGDTRANIEGTQFEDGDWIRLKIICPYVTTTEYGETTYSNSYDAFYLMKRTDSGWTPLTKDDHCDINGSYSYSGSPNPSSYYQAQQTPYVFMASTWSEEKSFRSPNGEVLQYCSVFHADQSKLKNFKASDLLWAQQFMQTGSWSVKLAFKHVMACVEFTVDDSSLEHNLTPEAMLSVEGMPDIDQQEVIVGDYYAAKSKVNSRYGYQQKNSCNAEYNGTVLGIGVNEFNNNRAYTYPMTGNPLKALTSGRDYSTEEFRAKIIPNTGVYKALKTGDKVFRMIVPPCELVDGASIWVRDGEYRYKMNFLPFGDNVKLNFEGGKLYRVRVILNSTAITNP